MRERCTRPNAPNDDVVVLVYSGKELVQVWSGQLFRALCDAAMAGKGRGSR